MASWYDGSSVLLTGASAGIGRELTKKLIRTHGCTVLGVGRSEEKLSGLKTELGPDGGRFSYRAGDVSDRAFWKTLAAETASGGFDLLFSCAGVMPPVLPFETLCADMEKNVFPVLDTDFRSELFAAESFLPVLERSPRAGFIQISSAVTCAPLPGMSMYAAAKAASRQFTEALGQELKGRVYVLCVCPGFARTSLFRGMPAACFSPLVRATCMPAGRMAEKILRAVSHRRRLVFPGADGRFMRLTYNLFGTRALDFFGWVLRISGIQLFAGVFPHDNKKEK